MAQDDDDGALEAAVPKRRYLLLAGVAVACLLGAGLGLWARPALSERGEPVAAAPERALPGDRRLQIVFDDTPAPVGQPLEVLTGPPPAAAPAAPPRPMTEAEPRRSFAAEPAPGPSLVERARPVARVLIASAEAAIMRIAEIKLAEPPADPAPKAAEPPVRTASAAAHRPAHKPQTASAAATRKHSEAQKLARLEARRAAKARALEEARLEAAAEARAERKAAEARAERLAGRRAAERLAQKARSEAIAKAAERRKVERLAAEQRAKAKAAALAEARAVARARAVREARAEAAAERRRRLAVLAHAPAKLAPRPARTAARAPKPPPAPLRAPRVIRASATGCVSADPGAAIACADPQLGAAERRLNRAYQRAEAAGVPEAELKRQQQKWLAARAAAAREAPWAVRDVYQARIAELEDMARSPRN